MPGQEYIYHFKEVSHTAPPPPLVPLMLMPCPVIAWTIDSSSELIYYLIHFLGETDSENHHIGDHGAEKYYAMPRFHSRSVWFFLLEQRETGMAIATDVDGDD